MIGRMMLAAAAAAATLFPAADAIAQERSFACEGGDPSGRAEIAERTDNFSMQLIMSIYADRWDALYVRAQCEAFADGEPHAITCIADLRDWDAIEASIPDDYYGMDRFTLAEFVPEERDKGPFSRDAYEYCREIGAIE